MSLQHAELAAAYLAAWLDPAGREAVADALGELVPRSGSRGWALALRLPTMAKRRIRPIAFIRCPAVCGRYTFATRRCDDIQARLAETLGVETPAPVQSRPGRDRRHTARPSRRSWRRIPSNFTSKAQPSPASTGAVCASMGATKRGSSSCAVTPSE